MSDRRRREQIDLCVGSASAIRLLPYRVFGSVYCCLASCVLFLGPPSSVRYSISSPFIPIFPFLRSRDEQRSWRWGKQCRVGFAAATTWVPWGTARSPHGGGSVDWSAVASAKENCSGGAASRQGVTACLPGGRAWVPHGVKCLKLYPSFPPFTESSPSVSLLILLPMNLNCVCDAA